jgi:hypothetical protein
MKIRIAVLENELKHAENSRDEAFQSSIHLSRVLGGLSGRIDNTGKEEREGLKLEVKLLKKENAVLWKRIKEKVSEREVDNSRSEGEVSASGPDQPARRLGKQRVFWDIQKGKWKSKLIPDESHGDIDSTSRLGIGIASKACIGSHKTQRVRGDPNGEGRKDTASASGSTTVPNSPIITPTLNSTTVSPFSRVEKPPNLTSHSTSQYADVGIKSLEEVFNDGFPPPVLSKLGHEMGDGSKRIRLLDGEGRGIDVELEEQIMEMGKLENLPAPGVLQTGFDITGSFGHEYDRKYDPSLNYPDAPRGPRRMAAFNRFTPFHNSTDSSQSPEDPSAETALFATDEQAHGAVEIHKETCSVREPRYPDFFRYGLRYIPAGTDSGYMRSVLIIDFPAATTLREIIARVRGGQIVSAILTNTIPLTGTNSAKIEFLHERNAMEYVDFCAEHSITFGEDSQSASVALIPTPTWPIKTPLSRAIFERKHTRILTIPDFPDNLSLTLIKRTLTHGSGHRANLLVDFFLTCRNTLHLEFSSISAAGSAFGILTNFDAFRGLEVCWDRDTCEGSLEDLKSPALPRHPMRPPHRMMSDAGVSPFGLQNNARLGDGEGLFVGSSLQRKRLAALENQDVSIPSFSGKGLGSNSWADEVNDEADDTESVLYSVVQSHCVDGDSVDTEETSISLSALEAMQALANKNYVRASRLSAAQPGLADSGYPVDDLHIEDNVDSFGASPQLPPSKLDSSEHIRPKKHLVVAEVVDSSNLSTSQPIGLRQSTPPRVILSSLLASDSETESDAHHSAANTPDGLLNYNSTDEELARWKADADALQTPIEGLDDDPCNEYSPYYNYGVPPLNLQEPLPNLAELDLKDAPFGVGYTCLQGKELFETPAIKVKGKVDAKGEKWSPNDADIESGGDESGDNGREIGDRDSPVLDLPSQTSPPGPSSNAAAGEVPFVKGQSVIAHEDPFGNPTPSISSTAPALKHQEEAVKNPDEIPLDDEVEEVLQFKMPIPSTPPYEGKYAKNDDDDLETPTRKRVGKGGRKVWRVGGEGESEGEGGMMGSGD